MRLFFTLLFPIFFLPVYSDSFLNDLASKASDAGPLLKNLLDKEKLGDKIGGILKGGSSSGSLNDDLAKMQFMMMMLKALQSSVDLAKNQNKTGFLNAESLASLFEMVQQYKDLFRPAREEPRDKESPDSQAANEFLKNLLAGLAEKSLDSSTDSINDAFAKNLIEQLLKGAAGEKPVAANESEDPYGQSDGQKFSLSDLNNLMNTMRELNNTIDRDQLKDLADSFKEYFSEPEESEEDEDRFVRESFGEPERDDYEGINTGLVVIVAILSSILLVIVLIMLRRCYKKRQFMASRMTEHRPLHSVSSEKVQI